MSVWYMIKGSKRCQPGWDILQPLWYHNIYEHFDREGNNDYLWNYYQCQVKELGDYSRKMNHEDWNNNEVDQGICTPGYSYELNSHGGASNYNMVKLSQIAQIILLLILHNIKPKGNMS